jgi:alkanesulfonate monooxygenase SsuD/methylene tetrahydromethanopterin reductase-like flavin-dependent oxidoreductase (luciferase family)
MIIGGQRSMNASTPIGRGLGISAGLEAGRARDLAVNCERLGYHSLWSNDEPTAAGLETLAQFAGAAPQLELGVGVLPLDRHQPVAIAAEIARLGLDPAKLWVGVGSGQLPAPLHIVQQAVAELRRLLPERTRIVLAAMRPRLCRIGGAIADGVLLNWMLPAQAELARSWVLEGADQAGRSAPLVASYVRVALGPSSLQRLRDEESHYRNINQTHRRHFEAMNVPLGSVGVAASTRSQVLQGLAPYHSAVDLPIVRLLAEQSATSLRSATIAAAP